MEKEKDSMVFPFRWVHSLEGVSDKAFRAMITAAVKYAETGELPSFSGFQLATWGEFRDRIDRDKTRYETRCKRNAENGAKGGRPKKQSEEEKPKKTDGFSEEPQKADGEGEGDGDILIGENMCVSPHPLETPKPDTETLQSAEKIFAEYPRKSGPNAAKLAIVAELNRQVADFGKTPEEAENILLQAAKAFSAVTWKWPEDRKIFIYTAENFFRKGHYMDPPEEWKRLGEKREETNPKKRKAEYGYEFKA